MYSKQCQQSTLVHDEHTDGISVVSPSDGLNILMGSDRGSHLPLDRMDISNSNQHSSLMGTE